MSSRCGTAMMCLAFVGLTAACSKAEPPSTIYEPLTDGVTLRYEVTATAGDSSATREILTKSLLPRQLDGRRVVPVVMQVPGSPATLYFFEQNSDGVHEYAVQNPQDAEPVAHKSAVVVLKNPLKKDLAWDTEDDYASPTARTADRIKLHVVVASTDDVVTVPAGTYTHCVKLVRTGIDPSPSRFVPSTNVEDTRWYAPNVGLVREIQRGHTGSGQPDAVVTLQLEAVEKPR